MSTNRRNNNVFSIAFLDLLSGALGAVIILFISVPKAASIQNIPKIQVAQIRPQKIKNQLITCNKENKKLHDISNDLTKANIKIEFYKQKVKQLKEENDIKSKEVKNQSNIEHSKVLDADVGFKFRGKKIVFVIDTSGSMNYENRIGQVIAGLKMLVTSLPSEYMINVIQFPYGGEKDFRALWPWLNYIDKKNKISIYNFLYDLSPRGATPTRSVMDYVLKKYSDASDIVLLSDGAPTLSNSKQEDDVVDLAKTIKQANVFNIQINTIGVGREFLNNPENPKYVFLNQVAKDSGGFFVGF